MVKRDLRKGEERVSGQGLAGLEGDGVNNLAGLEVQADGVARPLLVDRVDESLTGIGLILERVHRGNPLREEMTQHCAVLCRLDVDQLAVRADHLPSCSSN